MAGLLDGKVAIISGGARGMASDIEIQAKEILRIKGSTLYTVTPATTMADAVVVPDGPNLLAERAPESPRLPPEAGGDEAAGSPTPSVAAAAEGKGAISSPEDDSSVDESPSGDGPEEKAGQPVALHFRADWCPTCRAQDKALQSLKAEKGLDLRQENGIAKVYLANMVHRVVDTAIQLHGALGYSRDTPLAAWYTHIRSQRLVDGPDEVHLRTVARNRPAISISTRSLFPRGATRSGCQPLRHSSMKVGFWVQRLIAEEKSAAIILLLAGILGVDYDQLRQREAARRQRRMMAITGASAAGFVVMSGLTVSAVMARSEAIRQRDIARTLDSLGSRWPGVRHALNELNRLTRS